MSTSGLHSRIFATLDYTRWDDSVYQLLNVLECPILMLESDAMVMFNHQLYDLRAFELHRGSEERRNNSFLLSGYDILDKDSDDPNDCHRLKDPRTGQNLDCTTSLRSLLVSPPYREDFVYLITDRVIGITEEEAVEFLPEGDNSSEGQNNIKV